MSKRQKICKRLGFIAEQLELTPSIFMRHSSSISGIVHRWCLVSWDATARKAARKLQEIFMYLGRLYRGRLVQRQQSTVQAVNNIVSTALFEPQELFIEVFWINKRMLIPKGRIR
jgi:hypothetical protein